MAQGMAGILRLMTWIIIPAFHGWGFILCLLVIYRAFDLGCTCLAVLIFPGMLAIVPWYALFKYGDWLPLTVIYGGWAVSVILFVASSALDKEGELDY